MQLEARTTELLKSEMCDKQEHIFRRRLELLPSYQCNILISLPVGGSISHDRHTAYIHDSMYVYIQCLTYGGEEKCL